MPNPILKLFNLRAMRALSVALSVMADRGDVLAAVNDGPQNPAADDLYKQIADLDKQKQDVLNEPLDFCDPEAVSRQTREYSHILFEQFPLKRKLEKVHPPVKEAVKEAVSKVVQTFNEDGDLVVFSPIVEDYEAASRRGEMDTARGLLGKMSSWEQGQVAEWEHEYFLAIKLITPLADQGDVNAQTELLKLYTWDYGPPSVTPRPLPNDDAMALKYARILAAKGNRFGLQRLAKAYACGLGTTKDLVHAYAWFSVAAGQSAVSLHTYYEPEDLLRKRDFIAASMSHDDLLRARRLTVQCYKSEYKNCD